MLENNKPITFNELIKDIFRNHRRVLWAWGISMVLFLAAAIICVQAVFSGVFHGNEDYIVSYPATTVYGAIDIGSSWKRYPEYWHGLCAAGLICFIGAGFSGYNLIKTAEKK